jgi:hypothetical protein
LTWWQVRSVSNDDGVVTAELMLLLPSGILLAGLFGSALSVTLELMNLERQTASALRELTIGRELELPEGVKAESWQEGRLTCLKLTTSSMIPVSTSHCAIPLA